jgi:hypothetical protein
MNVCFNCFQALSKHDASSTAPSNTSQHNRVVKESPPKNLLKLMEANKAKEENSVDISLAARLEKLNTPKETKRKDLSEAELQDRLLKLQGRSQQSYLSNLPGKDNVKTPNDLIKRMTEEVAYLLRSKFEFQNYNRILFFVQANLDSRNEEHERLELKKLEERLNEIKEFNSKRSIPLDKVEGGSGVAGKVTADFKSLDPDSDDDEVVRKMLAEAEKTYKSQILNEQEV